MNRTPIVGLCAVLSAAALCLAGCRGTPEPAPPLPQPKLRDIAGPRVVVPVEPEDAVVHTRVLVERVDLPLHASLDAAWATLHRDGEDDDGVDASVSDALWRANGLRAATLTTRQLRDFLRALPKAVRGERQLIMTTQHATGLAVAPPVDQPVRIAVTRRGGSELPFTLLRGQPQFLVAVDLSMATPVLSVTPQHHFQRQTLRPLTPWEIERSGVVFDDMGIDVEMEPGRVLVIAYEPPPPTPPVPVLMPERTDDDAPPLDDTPEDATPDTDAPDDAPVPEPYEPLPVPPRILRLGDAALTAIHLGKPIQTLLIITVPDG